MSSTFTENTGKSPGLLSLAEPALRARLSELTPDCTNASTLAELIAELQDSVAEPYREFARFGDKTIDPCGTGGSGIARFNTSTAVAFVLASAGIRTAKFGNRAASGRSGSFDFLDAIGFSGTISAENTAEMLEQFGLAFIYAPEVYPALGRLASVRKQLGKPTVLNFIGPLLNPCKPEYRFMGVSHERMQILVHEFIEKHQPNSRATILRSPCGLDEVCPKCGAVALASGSGPANSLAPISNDALTCAGSMTDGSKFTAKTNAEAFFDVLDGTDKDSATYHIILTNAAHAFLSLGLNQMSSLEDALETARELLSSGQVKQTYLRLRSVYETHAR